MNQSLKTRHEQSFLFVDSVPGCGILSPLSTDSTPWFSLLLNGLPQLPQRQEDAMKRYSLHTVQPIISLFDH